MEVHFRPEDVPLRRDVNTLGRLLGGVLQELGDKDLYATVEAARQASIERRDSKSGADERLLEVLRGLQPRLGIEVVRAFSAYFELVNMAERVHRVRRGRAYARAGDPQRGSFSAVTATLVRAGVAPNEIRKHLDDLQCTLVFTAHPTQATRRTLLAKSQRVARALLSRIDPALLTPEEDAVALQRVRDEVGIAWRTEQEAAKPSVADEVESVMFYVADVIYRVVPALYDELERAVSGATDTESATELPRVLKLASWVGGDMDGNPNVGPTTILETLARHRELITGRYRTEVRELFDQLSHGRTRVGVVPELELMLERYRASMPGVYSEIPRRYHPMPYRMFLWLISARLEATQNDAKGGYQDPRELLADLGLIVRSLDECSGPKTGQTRVRRLIRRVETFGFHLATLDVRQDALVHRRAVGELLGIERFEELEQGPRIEHIEAALAALPAATPTPGGDLERSLSVMKAIQTARERFGPEAIGPLIISMAQGPDDSLAVLLLARVADIATDAGSVPLDVAPLFETVPDLDNAGPTLGALISHPVYAAHLRGRGRNQVVMLGYSDSNKESGIAAARWALHCAQESLVQTADAAGVELTLFHGRGGTISRGGGKPRSGILAEPPGAVRGKLRVTEQGEIIAQQYSLRDVALRSMELKLGAVLERWAAVEDGPPLNENWREAAQHLRECSRQAYRALVYESPEFVPYFRSATPIDVIERLEIGSRPASRRGGAGVENLRAIPWVFAWTQSRHLLPGWFGLGRGLRECVDRFGLERMQEMAKDWPFFTNLLGDTEMVLAKADLSIAERYAELAGASGEIIFPQIENEFALTSQMMQTLRGGGQLLDGDPVLRRAIRLRNPYVDPMSLLQVDYLHRWRASGRTDLELERALITTVRGIAQGMQNTG